MKNIKTKILGLAAIAAVSLALPSTGHAQIIQNGYVNVD